MRISLKMIIALIIASAFILSGPSTLFADPASNDTAELRREVAMLKERLSQLEVRLEKSEAEAVKIESNKPVPDEGALPAKITDFAKSIEVHGFVDTSYIFNTNTPVPPNARTNNFRVFDREANGFMLNMTQLNFEKPISKESPVGFRVDLDYGQDAQLIHSAGLGSAGDEFDLQQAYAQVMVPFSLPAADTLSFKIGKFATLHGAEVIESVNNWNFSRSYLFGYAIPFTHTGVRAYYKPFADIPVESYIGITNGWDQVVDNNRGKSVEAQVTCAPFDNFTFSLGGMVGPERTDSNKDFRNLIDLIATYKVNDKLTLKINYDYGWERNAASVAAGSLVGKDAAWDGVAAYAKYSILEWWSIAGRTEYFHDRDGVRTGSLTNAAMPISDLDLWEFTFTNEFQIFKNMLARLEYRYDKASGQVFSKDKETANYQNTISTEFIAKF